MVTKSRAKKVRSGLRNIDDVVKIVTGKRLSSITAKAVDAFGEEVAKKVKKMFNDPLEEELPPDTPYRVLGVNPDAPDFLVRGAYRIFAREYHPDTGTKADPAKFIKATEAYNAIMAERS